MIKIGNLENKKYWIWLSLIEKVGSKKSLKLLEKYQTPEKIWTLKKEQLLKTETIGEETVKEILKMQTREIVSKYIEELEKNEIEIITIKDKEYPTLLKQIIDPPIVLYVKGKKDILKKDAIAIIGCRQASDYGKKVAKYFAYQLAKKGIQIVSGLAKGVDSYSHIGALEANTENYTQQKDLSTSGKTIAVLGCGLDNIYPYENKELANQIIKKEGAIISEYPLGTKPEKMNFPARNRIISGLCKGILVVEAKEKSGTLITVDFALEQGRDVYVIPGNINSINSIGTNELIKQGAKMVTNYQEIEI